MEASDKSSYSTSSTIQFSENCECFLLLRLAKGILQNEGARRVLGDIDNLTEEKVDKVAEEFPGDVKENLVESKGWPINSSAYIVSKAALNAFARILARKYPRILINSVHPGYVSTDINFNVGPLTVDEGAKGPAMLALMHDGGPSGLFFYQTEVSSF